MLYVVMKAIFL